VKWNSNCIKQQHGLHQGGLIPPLAHLLMGLVSLGGGVGLKPPKRKPGHVPGLAAIGRVTKLHWHSLLSLLLLLLPLQVVVFLCLYSLYTLCNNFDPLTVRSVAMSVCFVYLSPRISPKPHGGTSPNFKHVNCGHGSVLRWRRCDMICTLGFVSDVIFRPIPKWRKYSVSRIYCINFNQCCNK